MLKVGDVFWEYVKDHNLGYPRHAHSQNHVQYFYKGYGITTFYTKEELLKKYPRAVVN